MDQIARTYAHLVLAVGQHDSNYVDAFYGPPEWKAEVEATPRKLDQIRQQAVYARAELNTLQPIEGEPILNLRWQALAKQLEALIARVDMLSGVNMTFDQESAALYDVIDTGHDDAFYADVVAKLEDLVPGTGPLTQRYEEARSHFFIPKDKLAEVFQVAVEAARERTKQYIPLAEGESFVLEYVSGEVWSAYNWYKGNAHSLIQVNTDFPVSIDRAIDLACHEGYPGHHVYNALLEQHLARERNWLEFTVYPLYSPQSLIAEGTAEYGVELSFPPAERQDLERNTLYPLAGIDPGRVEEFAEIKSLVGKLGYASNDAARRYLDGYATREETIDWLVQYALSTPERAAQRIRFIEQNRSYVVTYNIGKDLVKKYIERKATTETDRWQAFTQLLSQPATPSMLTN